MLTLTKMRTWLIRGYTLALSDDVTTFRCVVTAPDKSVVWDKSLPVTKEGALAWLQLNGKRAIAFDAFIAGQNRGVRKMEQRPPWENKTPQIIRGPESCSYNIPTTMRTRPESAKDVPSFLLEWPAAE